MESYTPVGTWLGGIDYVFYLLLLTLPALSWFHNRKIHKFIWAFLAVALACFILRVPTPYAPSLLAAMLFVGMTIITLKSERYKKNKMAALGFLGFIPLCLSSLGSLITAIPATARDGKITLKSKYLAWSYKGIPIALDRKHIDITYEKAWMGSGRYWGFYGPSLGNIVSTNTAYWSSRDELLDGDQVAKRIAQWAGTKPRLVINGQSRDWQDPHPALAGF